MVFSMKSYLSVIPALGLLVSLFSPQVTSTSCETLCAKLNAQGKECSNSLCETFTRQRVSRFGKRSDDPKFTIHEPQYRTSFDSLNSPYDVSLLSLLEKVYKRSINTDVQSLLNLLGKSAVNTFVHIEKIPYLTYKIKDTIH